MSDLFATLGTMTLALMLSLGVAAIVFAVGQRALAVQRVTKRTEQRTRRHELHWTAIRLRNLGYLGTDLQETICRETNCAPDEADAAILRGGADL